MENLETKKFTKINESFVCKHCGKLVPISKKSCRNHCPYCLYSMHIDVNPGDRASECGGMMKAIGYELSSKKGLVLIFKCEKCGIIRKNIASVDEEVSDDYDLILKLNQDI